MKVLLETKDRNEVIKWMVSILAIKYEEYTSLFNCGNKEMRDFLNDCIKETLCDHCVHLGRGFVENIGNILCNYIFCINCGEGEEKGTYKIIYDEEHNGHFVEWPYGWCDWSLWDDYDVCLKEACSIFASNVF